MNFLLYRIFNIVLDKYLLNHNAIYNAAFHRTILLSTKKESNENLSFALSANNRDRVRIINSPARSSFCSFHSFSTLTFRLALIRHIENRPSAIAQRLIHKPGATPLRRQSTKRSALFASPSPPER